MTAKIAEYESYIGQLPADDALVPKLKAEIQNIQRDLKNRPALQKELEIDEQHLAEATRIHEHLSRLKPKTEQTSTQVDPAAVDQLIMDIESPTPEVNSKDAGDELITMSMTNPDSLNEGAAERLANNTNNGLTDHQRDYLRNFAEAKKADTALKKMGDVAKEIRFGSKANLGIEQYKQRISDAINSGNESSAQRYLGMLNNFVTGHNSKARAARDAEMGSDKWIVRTPTGWETVAEATEEQRKNGARRIESSRLVDAIEEEADLLQKTQNFLITAVKHKFKLDTTTQTQLSLLDQAKEAVKKCRERITTRSRNAKPKCSTPSTNN